MNLMNDKESMTLWDWVVFISLVALVVLLAVSLPGCGTVPIPPVPCMECLIA